MRSFALVSGGLALVVAQAVQVPTLPAPLAKHYATLAAAASLKVAGNVGTVGEAPVAYTLVLSRPGSLAYGSPTETIVSDGKKVTVYTVATKTYTEEPYTEAWAAAFAKRPEILPWGAFLLKEPLADVAGAKAGASRAIGTNQVMEFEVTPKKGTPVTLFLDRKLGVARGVLLKGEGKETLVVAKTVEIGKAAEKPETFAFVPPDGARKADPVPVVTFAQVNALIADRCAGCHGANNPKAGISLHNYDAVVKTVVPGDPKGSLLVRAVKGDGVKKMPLGNHPAYSAAEIAQLEAWIAAGAKAE